MNKLLRSFTIPVRLFAQVAIVSCAILALLTYSLNYLHDSLLNSKRDGTKALVETAFSLIEKQHEAFKNGDIDEATAKDNALRAIESLRYEGSNYFWVNDTNAVMIMHPIKPELNGKNLADFEDPTGKKLFTEMVNVVKSNGKGEVDYKWPKPGFEEPVDKISYVMGFEPWGYIVGSGTYIDDVDSTFWLATKEKLTFALIIFLLVTLISFAIAKSVTRPIKSVVIALREIAAGNGDLTQRLNKDGRDEITHLAEEFNLFVSKINTLIQKASHTSESIITAVEQSNSSSEIAHESVKGQKNQVNDVVNIMDKISESTTTVSKNANDAAESTATANASCLAAKDVVADGVESVKSLVVEVERASGVINNLQGNVSDIVTVLEVIRGIAEQTNLLALNAAIEAARAGEQGRGFAVVADEVRTLASRTQESTEEIQTMIQRLEQGSQEAVNVMETSKQVGEKTLKNSMTAGNSLDEITKAVTIISGMNTTIADVASQQDDLMESVTNSISRISEETNKTAQANDNNKTIFADLNAKAQELNDLMKQFKV